MIKIRITILVLIVLLAVGIFWAVWASNKWMIKKIQNISSFEDCAGAGYPIMESYPRQCNTPDGRHFVEKVENPPFPPKDSGQMCIQVITPAKNPQTGEIVEFPTPCDVPEGWEKVSE
ncbi:MAG: hypothetical protein UV58_C0011G0024 [Candidatus Wolfebacteria bacterium GW2011_GWC1_43_10]|uniref:Uncharacterized protein n=2 Tax=Candidatus Wolfeibacteriota TaxID=1752735 RepID=A0A0G1C9E1_9BACT|nr:MAG: hypothetical protein UV58_C0011G0024 [Candidatus Wolfebacteria bacterium GW2011_GWC1_43_10]KKT22585.1 MAG: hypothetical protein UW08_C0006G0025 [Parcubacteria group bacterium GW2011_GWB1_43_8b]OGM89856.1 MAG: hypothetical protein A2108_00970 [Candidatus Wolfebacteria bacterium GWA1_42_9]